MGSKNACAVRVFSAFLRRRRFPSGTVEMCHPCEGFPNESTHQAALGTRYYLCECCSSAGKKEIKKNPRSARVCFNKHTTNPASSVLHVLNRRLHFHLVFSASPTVLWCPTGILPPPGFCRTAPRLKREHLTGSRRKVSAYQNTSRCEELICLGESLQVPPPRSPSRLPGRALLLICMQMWCWWSHWKSKRRHRDGLFSRQPQGCLMAADGRALFTGADSFIHQN